MIFVLSINKLQYLVESLLMSKEHDGIFRSITDYFEFF